MFKAIRVLKYGGPEVLTLAELPRMTPKAGQVLVSVKAAGVNPVDVYMREGWHSNSKPCPYTPGLDSAGIVLKVGEGVTSFKEGDRVCSAGSLSGCYATEALFNENQLYHLPENITMQEGAAIGTSYFTAYYAYLKLNPQPNEWVFIHGGSGGVGTALCQICAQSKCKTVASTSNPSNIAKLKNIGVDEVVLHNQKDHMERVQALTGGGPKYIFEMLANKNLAADIKVLKKGGKVGVIGNRGAVEINPRDLMVNDGEIHGIMLFNASDELKEKISKDVFKMLEEGKLKPILGTHYKLEEAITAHKDVIEHRNGAWGRIIIDMEKV